MTCRCDARYERESDCPRCSSELPDGPDELLAAIAEAEAAELAVATEDDDAPTEPMLELSAGAGRPLTVEGTLRCSCGVIHRVRLVAPEHQDLRRTRSVASLECSCGRLVAGLFSWTRRCFVSVRVYPQRSGLPN